MKRWLPRLIKIFLIGLLLQFIIQTFVTFKLGRDMSRIRGIWMRKELLVITFGGWLLYWLWKEKKWHILRQDSQIRYVQIILGVFVILSLILSLIVHRQGLGQRLLAFKYDIFGYCIFFIMLHLSAIMDRNLIQKLLGRYVDVMKRCLRIALFRRLVILIKPGVLTHLFGYSRGAAEGTIGMPPPATYKTHFDQGFTRNQFLFERPIMYGFRLVAFRPLFFYYVVRRKSFSKVGIWRIVYGLNIFLTFSRAAWVSRLVVTGLLLLLTYKKHRKIFILFGIGGIAGLGGLLRWKSDALLERTYSDTGHIKMLQKGRTMFIHHPVAGKGAAMAGPGSHQLGDPALKFNPENQFLQLLDEFGIWGLLWIGIFVWMIVTAMPSVRFLRQYGHTHKYKKDVYFRHWIQVCLAVGMVGLGVSGMVLHSFSDRMIVYPMMMMYGVIWGKQNKTEQGFYDK